MASPKALAAIALTLIIAMPIGLGYALSSETVQESSWATTDTVNLSDSLLNSSSPYYSSYADAMNNSTLLTNDLASFVSPSYISTSSTYTSIPIYTNGSGSITLSSVRTGTSSVGWQGGGMFTMFYIGLNPGDGSGVVGDIISVNLTPDRPYTKLRTYDGTSSGPSVDIPLLSGNQSLLFLKNEDGNYTLTYNGNNYVSKYFLFYPTTIGSGYSSCNITYYANDFQELSIPYTSWTVNLNGANISLKLTTASGNVIISSASAQSITKTNDVVIFEGSTYAGVTNVYLASLGTPTINYTYRTTTGTYADPAYGWRLPTVATYLWTNTFTNNYIRIMVHFPTADYISIKPQSNTGILGETLTVVHNTDGTLVANGELLGIYDTVMIELSTESTKITGLVNGWPSFGSAPVGYNTITLDPLITTNIEFLRLFSQYTTGANFRIDSANILAGSFPSTEDYNLDMAGMFPNKSYSLKLNSVGIYGDTISFGSDLNPPRENNGAGNYSYLQPGNHTITRVNTNTITVDGRTINQSNTDEANIYSDYFRINGDNVLDYQRGVVHTIYSSITLTDTTITITCPAGSNTPGTFTFSYTWLAYFDPEGDYISDPDGAYIDSGRIIAYRPYAQFGGAYQYYAIIENYQVVDFHCVNRTGSWPNVTFTEVPSTDYTYALDVNSENFATLTVTRAGQTNTLTLIAPEYRAPSDIFEIVNGRITVDGTSIPLKGATITSLYDGSGYVTAINGKVIGTYSQPASVFFGGEWSLTATANILKQETVTSQEWAAGQFAFDDKESFSGALLLAIGAVFIGVGIYGARSGNKIGLLLIVCGGAALFAINLI